MGDLVKREALKKNVPLPKFAEMVWKNKQSLWSTLAETNWVLFGVWQTDKQGKHRETGAILSTSSHH